MDTLGQLIWYLQRSVIFRHFALGQCSKILVENLECITNEVEKYVREEAKENE